MALYTRIGIATSRKRMWPFQIDRIGVPPWSADILSAVSGHPARSYPLAAANGFDTTRHKRGLRARIPPSHCRWPNPSPEGNYGPVEASSQSILFPYRTSWRAQIL